MSKWIDTEFGKYPSHWKSVSIQKLQSDKLILVEDGNHGNYRPLLEDFVEEGIAYIKAGDINNNLVVFEDAQNINNEAYSRLRKGRSKNGDTIITHKGTVGKVGYIRQENIYPHVCSPQTTFYRSLDNDEIRGKFVFFFLLSPFFQNQFDSMSGETDMAPYVSLTNQRTLTFLIPPLKEQDDIIQVLSSITDKINILENQNRTLAHLGEACFKKWFILEPKGNWEERPLSKIANFLNGLACQKFPPENEVDKLPVLKIKQLRSGFNGDEDWCTTGVKPEYIVEEGDVIFSWSASLMVKIWDGQKCVLNQHLFKVTSDEFPKWFYYSWCKHHLAEFISISASHATTMGHIKRSDLDEAMVLVPDTDTMNTYSETMSPLLNKMMANNRQLHNLTNLRDTLLPKLMSGEITISDNG